MTIIDSANHKKWFNYSWFWGSKCIYTPITKYTKDGNSINTVFKDIKRK